MCFAGKFHSKTYQFWSISCDKEGKPKNVLRTNRGLTNGNYHFWCVDRITNKIIDNTPQFIEPDSRRIGEDPIYIPWCDDWQKEQKEYCKENLYNERWVNDGWDSEETDDYLIKYVVGDEDYEKLKCFKNSYALYISNRERYKLVCGSFGWVLDETKNNTVIGLDYGW